jgi:hypothetical protein
MENHSEITATVVWPMVSRRAFEHCTCATISEAAMSAKHRPKQEGSPEKNKNEDSGKTERREPNLGQEEAREEREKASDLAHMGEMSDQPQSKRR